MEAGTNEELRAHPRKFLASALNQRHATPPRLLASQGLSHVRQRPPYLRFHVAIRTMAPCGSSSPGLLAMRGPLGWLPDGWSGALDASWPGAEVGAGVLRARGVRGW